MNDLIDSNGSIGKVV